MVCIFTYHRINHHPIAGQTFLDNPRGQRRTLDSLLLTGFTGSLLALSHPHEVFSRFDIELLSSLVADDGRLLAALAADALLRATSNDLLCPRQMRWQLLPTRMFADCSER